MRATAYLPYFLAALPFALAVSVLPRPTTAQSQSRPTIGLVLSGGGGRGLAHVGVLRELEEQRIPVDFIAGTSMGAIIGALYALGLSADEIEHYVARIDWNDLFSDKPARRSRSFRRKQDHQAGFVDLELGLEGGRLRLPRSVVTGQKFAFAFPIVALHTAGHRSFDDLPIPFRAVATDLETGEMVVLNRGSLVRALRASMAVPGFFPPVEVESRLLVDGGLVRNVPVDVARDMGADVVIAVDVGELPGYRKREDLQSLSDYGFQVLSIALHAGVEEALAQADIVIRPDLGHRTLADFSNAADAIARGRASGQRARALLDPYRLPAPQYAAYRQDHRRVALAAPRIDAVRIANRSRVDDAAIRGRLSIRSGDMLDLEQLERDLGQVYDLGILEHVDFDLAASTDLDAVRKRTLIVSAREKGHGATLVRFGVAGAGNLRGDVRFALSARVTRMELNRFGAEWRNDFSLGTRTAAHSEWYQPLDTRRSWFAALSGQFTDENQFVYAGEQRVADERFRTWTGALDLGARLGDAGELRAGIFTGHVDPDEVTGESPLQTSASAQGGVRVRVDYDTLDDGDFPRLGGVGSLVWKASRPALGARHRYERLAGSWSAYRSWRRSTVFVSLAGGTNFDRALPAHEEFLLGGFTGFAGLEPGQLRGSFLAAGRLGSYVHWSGGEDRFGVRSYAGGWADLGNLWSRRRAARLDDLMAAGALFLAADTVIGPAFVSWGWASSGQSAFAIGLGLRPELAP